jgi:hypothetical protein
MSTITSVLVDRARAHVRAVVEDEGLDALARRADEAEAEQPDNADRAEAARRGMAELKARRVKETTA